MYWQRNLSRRRVIRGGLALGMGATALSLVGCSSDSEQPGVSSSVLHKPRETKVTYGGTLSLIDDQKVDTLEPFLGGFEGKYVYQAYSRLVQYKLFKYPEPALSSFEGDAALSWETSPDGLYHTYKMRPNMKFDPRPPTNGRVMSSADVAYSLEMMRKRSPNAVQLFATGAQDAGPIESWTAPDEATVVIKTAYPYGPLNALLANRRMLTILPLEAYDQYNVKSDMRGSGPWRLKELRIGAGAEFEKNPDWYNANKVALDGQQWANLPEYAAASAQFRAGNVWTYPIRQEEVLQFKQELPQLLMKQQQDFPLSSSWIRFGYLPDSPFRDVRVRRAMSMLIDRDLYLNVIGNVDLFEKAGLEVPRRWNTAVPCGEDDFWLDPQKTKEFGDTAKFYQYNPAEARALLKATGRALPIETMYTYRNDSSPAFFREQDILRGMWEAHDDFKVKVNIVDNRSVLIPQYTNSKGRHEGIATGPVGPAADVDAFLYVYYKTGGNRAGHLDSNGQPDAHLDALLLKQREETNLGRRTEVLKEFQRYTAGQMYMLHTPGAALGFDLAHPWYGNWGLYRARLGAVIEQSENTTWWYDASKKK